MGFSNVGSQTMTEADDVHLLKEYCIVWCIHQLLPFSDVILGIQGAVDARRIEKLDWLLRLPAILALVFRPGCVWLACLAHVLNISLWAAALPVVWDHMSFARARAVSNFSPYHVDCCPTQIGVGAPFARPSFCWHLLLVDRAGLLAAFLQRRGQRLLSCTIQPHSGS